MTKRSQHEPEGSGEEVGARRCWKLRKEAGLRVGVWVSGENADEEKETW